MSRQGKILFGSFSKKLENPHDPAISLPGTYPKESKEETLVGMCPARDVPALFTTVKRRSNLSVHQHISRHEMEYVHTVGYHSPVKKKEILIYAATWMNPGLIMLNGIRQPQRDKYCMSPLI
jgi:hypothetical protein